MNGRNLRKNVLREARSWVGTPYRHQASTRGHGCDCLGLIRGVWRKLYDHEPQEIPVYTRDWGETGHHEPLLLAAKAWFVELPRYEARAGDVVVFRWKNSTVAKHAGILSRRDCFIHAYERVGTVETHLGPHWQRRIAGYFRFPEIK